MYIIEDQSKISSKKARVGSLSPKKNKLHKMLSKRLTAKTLTIEDFWSLSEFVHAKYKERAIKKNKIFQTTGKTQFGGVIEGFIDSYQSLSTLINKLPMNAVK